MKNILKFGWGDTRGIREVLLSTYDFNFKNIPLDSFGYPPYEGDPNLIGLIRDLTKDLTGKTFNRIAITNGCTQAVGLALDAIKTPFTNEVETRDLYYPRYPDIIKRSGMLHVRPKENLNISQAISLIDSPSNPEGSISGPKNLHKHSVWDGAYHSPTYGLKLRGMSLVDADIYCGSMSKLSGMNGLRLGWVATDSDDHYTKIVNSLKVQTCGVSWPSQWLSSEILSNKELLEVFFTKSRALVEDNKNEVLKLRKIFGTDLVSDYGMFAFTESDEKIKNLFRSALVEFTDGSDCGADFDSMRLNLGNTRKDVVEMVKRILKEDKKGTK